LEWRISTSLAERCLMFDLDMTQIKCYVLMKMILKSFLNPQGEINISSFMCKTILFHCIEQEEPSIWEENNLLECLKVCLMKLKSCVQNDNLSHFIIPENNLIAGQFTAETKHLLLKNISDFIQNDVQSLLRIEIDFLGHRLQNFKLNFVLEKPYDVLSYLDDCESAFASNCLLFPKDFFQKDVQSFLRIKNKNDLYSFFNICENVSASNYSLFFMICLYNHHSYLNVLQNKDIGIMKQIVERLMTYNNTGNELEHAAFTFLAPFIFTTYGSALASESIGLKNQVSPQAMVLLIDGLKSDVLSDRLKLASVFYSTGDIERTELILRHTESQYYSNHLAPICECFLLMPSPSIPSEIHRVCNERNEDCVKNITAFCVRFLKQEINCVPHELQFEMFRSSNDDIKHRNGDEKYWMDWAVVDSLPFLYFLQYKVYRHLQRYQIQQQALTNLANTIETEKDLGHKETALNILGQCMEQENRPKQALKCYLLSLRQRARNNAAKIHICRLLSSYLDCKAIDKNNKYTYIMICLNIMQYLLELNRSY
jgi:tetratricopeptide (TPR) repeat protein